MLNLFKSPFEIETLDSWAKLSDEIAKVAILAIPVVVYAQHGVWLKLLNIGLLVIITYLSLSFGRVFRKMKIQQEKRKRGRK